MSPLGDGAGSRLTCFQVYENCGISPGMCAQLLKWIGVVLIPVSSPTIDCFNAFWIYLSTLGSVAYEGLDLNGVIESKGIRTLV